MTDPFKIYQPSLKEDPDDSEPSLFEEGPDGNGLTGMVEVSCTCGVKITRTLYPPYNWVHVGDEVIVRNGIIIQASAYDHLPVLEVIDVEVVDG